MNCVSHRNCLVTVKSVLWIVVNRETGRPRTVALLLMMDKAYAAWTNLHLPVPQGTGKIILRVLVVVNLSL